MNWAPEGQRWTTGLHTVQQILQSSPGCQLQPSQCIYDAPSVKGKHFHLIAGSGNHSQAILFLYEP